MLSLSTAPYIIPTRRKDSRKYLALCQAFQAAQGLGRVLPVLYEDGVLGHVVGNPFGRDVWFRPWDDHSKFFGDYDYQCAINSYDDLIGAMGAGRFITRTFFKTPTTTSIANNWYDLFRVTGMPDAGTYTGAARTSLAWTDTTAGCFYHGGNVSTRIKYLSRYTGSTTANNPTILLYDRVLTYEACTISNAPQNMINGAPAPRYIASGEPGLNICITGQTVLGATPSSFTQLRYTDENGTGSVSATITPAVSAIIVTAAAPTATLGARIVSPSVTAATISRGAFYPLTTRGCRRIENYQMNTTNTGTLCFVLAYPLAICPPAVTQPMVMVSQAMQVGGMPVIKDGAFLNFLVYGPATTAHNLYGFLDFVWG